MSDLSSYLIERPRVDWKNDRPFALSRLSIEYTDVLEKLAISKESVVKSLPAHPAWEKVVDQHPTTSRFSSYSSFLLSPSTLPLFFAIRELYRHLLRELDQHPTPRFIQCWYNIHRSGDALVRHKHNYPFIGTFSAHAEGSETRYGTTRDASESDVIVVHPAGQLMVTTGPGHYHQTSVWLDSDRPRVTYAFDIANAEQWKPGQVFLPFDM